ncbi:hypothetical protein JCM33374_g5343 [Metschnikowia sp. JCM 33374]|nr:hypothetical protein JCM33374_g5343 [Metschnikowia sp. JCM 33374]
MDQATGLVTAHSPEPTTEPKVVEDVNWAQNEFSRFLAKAPERSPSLARDIPRQATVRLSRVIVKPVWASILSKKITIAKKQNIPGLVILRKKKRPSVEQS